MEPIGIKADTPRSYSNIEACAKYLRTILKLPTDVPMPGVQLFERLSRGSVRVNGSVIPLDYDVKDLVASTEAFAWYNPDRRKIEIVLSIPCYDGLEREEPRARFSLCHEIGHAILHSSQLVRMAHLHEIPALHRGKGSDHPAYLDTEWQANAFSSALLVPAEGLAGIQARLGNLDETIIMKRFGVSAAAARIRLGIFRQRRQELLSV